MNSEKKKLSQFLRGKKYNNIQQSKKICVIANGCPENRIDGAAMRKFLRADDLVITENFQEADIIFFNSCALTQHTQELSIETIKQIKSKKKSSAELIVCGCLPKINKTRLQEVYQGPTFGPDELERLNTIMKTKTKAQDIHSNFLLPRTVLGNKLKRGSLNLTYNGILITITNLLTYVRTNRINQAISVVDPHIFCIKISTGCLNNCSYCAIKRSRGKVKSKPIETIVKEFEEGLKSNYKKFALIGTDIGSYGMDQGTNLVVLLNELLKKKGNYKIKLRNVNPRFLIKMMPELRQILQSGKISFISSSVQSGNNRILGLMNRGHKIEEFKQTILTLNEEFPEIYIRTQVMVGFPSETEEEFYDTVRLIDELSFDFVEVYMFQPRPNTKAAKMKNQIEKKAARRRYLRLYVKTLFNQMHDKKLIKVTNTDTISNLKLVDGLSPQKSTPK